MDSAKSPTPDAKPVAPNPPELPPARSSARNIINETPYAGVSDYQQGEIVSATASSGEQPAVITLDVPANMVCRKIYGWIFTPATTDFNVRAVMRFFRNRTKVGEIPFCAGLSNSGASTVLPRSICSSLSAGGSVGIDTLTLFVGKPILADGQPTSVLLQPLYVEGEFDRATVAILSMDVNSTYARIFAAIISSSKYEKNN